MQRVKDNAERQRLRSQGRTELFVGLLPSCETGGSSDRGWRRDRMPRWEWIAAVPGIEDALQVSDDGERVIEFENTGLDGAGMESGEGETSPRTVS